MLEIDTKPDTAAEDAAQLLFEVSGRLYMEIDTALTWLRRTHPTARIVTTCLSEFETTVRIVETFYTDNYNNEKRKVELLDSLVKGEEILTRQATFRAELVIDGEIISTGHGTETRAKFPGYYEKAESIAIRRMCVNAGYSLEMLKQLGYRLAEAPKGDNTPAAVNQKQGRANQQENRTQPTPVTKPIETPRPAPPKPIASSTPPAETPAAVPSPPPTGIQSRRPPMLSGESGPPEPDTTVIGCVQAAPMPERTAWRKSIAESFANNPTFDRALDELSMIASADMWRWIILLQIAENSAELNHIMRAASGNKAGKIVGPAWSAATKEKAQALAAANKPAASS